MRRYLNTGLDYPLMRPWPGRSRSCRCFANRRVLVLWRTTRVFQRTSSYFRVPVPLPDGHSNRPYREHSALFDRAELGGPLLFASSISVENAHSYCSGFHIDARLKCPRWAVESEHDFAFASNPGVSALLLAARQFYQAESFRWGPDS